MIILFNIGIIGLVLLIAYWWSNEGLFSSLLHLVCVIAAGAIALAVWEPITISLMSGGGFDNYAWGIVLVGSFAVTLLVLRIACDKLVPANLKFPPWANMAFGGLAGFASGVLTIGICLIGSGFVQSTNEIMSYRGTARDENGRSEITKVGDPIWLDVAQLTSKFFGVLSVGTLHPDFKGGPLQQYNPNIDELSTLVRDTYDNGKGQLSLLPDAANVSKVAKSADGMVLVQVNFKPKARDFGSQLILAKSQIRLITLANGTEEPNIYYPMGWKQEVQDVAEEQIFKFDDNSHFATSIPGRTETGIKFAFDTRDANVVPKFIQIRGTRLNLPSGNPIDLPALAVQQLRGIQLSDDEILAARDPLGKDIQHLVEASFKIRGLRISTNGLPGTIEVDDFFFVRGTLNTNWSRSGVSSALAIKGIQSDEGTSIIQLEVTPGKEGAFEDLVPIISPDSPVLFIDSDGRKYEPIGYIIGDEKRMKLSLTPGTPIQTVSELPMHTLTSSNSKTMKLIFQITVGVQLREFRVGDHTIGTCNVKVERSRR